jgi:hypothetical protein
VLRSLRRGRTAVAFGVRRLAARPLPLVALSLALGAAAALIGWSSVRSAIAHEENVRLRLDEAAIADRSFHIAYRIGAGGADWAEETVAGTFARLGAVTQPPIRTRIWHSRGATASGVRFVRSDAIALASGRRPVASCPGGICETIALAGTFQVGQTVTVDEGTKVRVVGTGVLPPAALPDPEQLGRRALAAGSPTGPLAAFLAQRPSTVVAVSLLDGERIRGSVLRALHERLRLETIYLERAGPEMDANAPLALVDDLADRGEIARTRVLLVAGQGAALIIAFAAFAATARRRDASSTDEQLSTLGATRPQVWTTRVLDAFAPALIGGAVAVAAVLLLAERAAATRDFSSRFVASAFPPGTLLAMVATMVAAALILLAAASRPRRSRFGLGGLEVAAVTALALVVWQASATGGLDPDRISAGESDGPVLLLLPALAAFVTAIALLRLLPLVLRAGERAARAGPFSVRLALVTAGRSPAHAAAATTFLAIALGAAVFALNYAATLERQARDEAAFAAAAAWRVIERGEQNVPGVELGRGSAAPGDVAPSLGPARDRSVLAATDVTPLTRYRSVTDERPTPVLRLPTRLAEPDAAGSELTVEVLGVPASRITALEGWRDSFSSVRRDELAQRLHPRPMGLRGPAVPVDATALRVSARADTVFPRIAVAHFLLPREQRFRPVVLGFLRDNWRPLSVDVPATLRGARLVGIEFPPVYQPFGSIADLGFIELRRLEARRPGGWARMAGLQTWAASRFGGAVHDPVEGGADAIRFEVQDTPLALMRPEPALPDAVPGLASPAVAAAAAGETITLELLGEEIRVRLVAVSELFPGIVTTPSSFVVLDYDALFAALNVDRPGIAVPSEAWFFGPQEPTFAERLGRPPFRAERIVEARALETRLLNDPLAAGVREVLRVSGIAAVFLAVLGLVLATRAALVAERMLFAEYEALGIAPRTLIRTTQVRFVALAILGLAGGFAGGLVATRLVSSLVAVTGTGGRPIPAVEPVIAWVGDFAALALAAAIGVGAAAFLAAWMLRESAARRLRA